MNAQNGRSISGGRLQLPSDVRCELGLADGELHIRLRRDVLKRSQAMMQPYARGDAPVVVKLIDRGASPDKIADIMALLDIDIVAHDGTQAMTAGLLRRETRSSGLSLGDRACLALVEPLKVEVLASR